MNEPVRVGLLGPLVAARGSDQVDLGPAKQRAVLAVLLLRANQPVSVDAIIDAVWDERPPADGPNVVSKYVGRLRRLTGVVIDRTAAGYLAHADHTTLDVADFERRIARAREGHVDVRAELAGALALWRGTPLAGMSGVFFDTARQRLGEQRMAALEERVDIDLATGVPADLVVELTGLVAEHPLRERLAGQLMRALHLAGRQADALTVHQRLRTRLRDELGIDPGREITALYERILRDDDVAPRPARRDRRIAHPVPSQLRHDIPDFVGRDAELSELSGTSVPICAIDGIAGVGKTATALHLAHRVADRFPDGHLYVDLRGFDSDHAPLAPADVLGRFLRALGVAPQRVPTDPDEMAALYRSALARRRVLIVLDNAVSPEQVRPLLPGTSGSLVLVTSRRSLAGLAVRDGAHRITLGTLPPDDAAALVTGIVGGRRAQARPAAVTELARLCGHLPLALCVAAQRVANHPTMTLADVVDELVAERGRLDALEVDGDDSSAVRAVFSWSYRALDDAAARAFRLLGLHPTPEFGLPAAAALLDASHADTRRLLATLTGLHLVQDNGKGRYQLHDLMRVYAMERAVAADSAAERTAAVRRVLSWYVHTSDAAGTVLVPYRQRAELGDPPDEPVAFRSPEHALDWYETERANLIAAQQQAIDIGAPDVAWQLPVTMWDVFYLRSQWADWIAAHELGVSAARAAADVVGEAGVLTSLGHAYLEVGRAADALAVIEVALARWRAAGHRWGEGMALHILGGVDKAMGRLADSVDHYRQALAMHAEIDNKWGIGWTLAALGTTYHELRDYERALETSQRATAMWRDMGDRYGEGFTLTDLGDDYVELGRFDDAVAHYRMAADLNHQIGNGWSEAAALTGLGNAMRATGRTAEARASWSRALDILDDLGDPRADTLRDRLAALT
jgi:DNA-binding SARP family transcriptional activator/tetratricopeptide (TPR) repeat protein